VDAAFVMFNSFGLKDQNLIRYVFPQAGSRASVPWVGCW